MSGLLIENDAKEIPPRFGTSSCIINDQLYVWRGSTNIRSGSEMRTEAKSLYSLNIATLKWKVVATNGELPKATAAMEMCAIEQTIYVFGGWEMFGRHNDVHRLPLDDKMTWELVKPVNPTEAPLNKDKFGMVEHDGRLVVFAGAAEADIRQSKPGVMFFSYDTYGFGWTNELHVFDPKTCVWCVPDTTGETPQPSAASSFTKVSPHLAVLFGGRQKDGRVNDLAILDMDKWVWNGVFHPLTPQTLWPEGRSFHSAVSLLDPTTVQSSSSPKLLVLWGLSDGKPVGNANKNERSGEVLDDAWVLDVKQVTWTKVSSLKAHGRLWHNSTAYYLSPCECQVVTFGGSPVDLYRFGSNNKMSDTILMEFGVKTLFRSCAMYINENRRLFENVLCLLPVQVLGYVNDCVRYDRAKKIF